MTEFQQVHSMRHLRQVFSLTFLLVLLGGCSSVGHWAPAPCPQSTAHAEKPAPAVEISEPAAETYKPTVYHLDSRRTLEVWDTASNGHYTFLQNGKSVRTEPLAYCSAEPLFPNSESAPESPAFCLTGTRTRFVIVCQQAHGDLYLYTVYKVASGFAKVAEFETKTPLTVVKIERAYRFAGNDFLPGFGAQQCYSSVVFKYEKGKLKLDRKSMQKKLPSPSQLRTTRQEIRAQFKDPNDIPGSLFDCVFAFYYCGEVQKAKQFFNSVYPKNQAKKAFWWNFVKEQISQSSYRKQIEEFAQHQ